MNTGGEAADQIVRISLNGAEVAIKLAGEGAKNLAILLYTILSDQKKTRGKSRLSSMLRSGKELKVFSVNNADLKLFVQEAKKYGVLYCALKDPKGSPDGMTDIMVRAEDASKINRIVERFKFAAVDTAKIKAEIEQSREEQTTTKQEHEQVQEHEHEKVQDAAPANERELDELLDDMLGSSESPQNQDATQTRQEYEQGAPLDTGEVAEQYEIGQGAQNQTVSEHDSDAVLDELYEVDPANPTRAETEKDPLSKPSSQTHETTDIGKGTDTGRRSVREELREIRSRQEKKQEAAKEEPQRKAERNTKQQQPQNPTAHKKSRKKKSKGKGR